MVNSLDNQIASPAQNVRGEDLFTSEAVQTLQKYVAHLREYVLLQEAWEAARNLEELFSLAPQASEQFPGAYQAMQTLLWQCRAICFPLLEDGEVAELFGTHVGLVIDVHGGELWNMVRALMVKEYDYKKRDALKERLLTRLLHSQERITSKGPLLGGKEATPTVENWIMDYVASVGTGQADAFKRSAWLTRSPSIVRLSEQEKIRVRLAMMLRDKLPISSTALEGLEEVISENNKGRPVWLREGRLEEMPESQYAEYKTGVTAAVQARTEAYREAREKAARELLLEKYEKWTNEPVIEEAYRIINAAQPLTSPKEAGGILARLYTAINEGEASRVVTSLWALARAGKVRAAFTDSERYRMYWERHMPDELKNEKDEFQKGPAGVKFLLPFLRHVLVNRLKMDSEMAKIAVMTMAQDAVRAGESGYANMAYGDLETGVFEWADITTTEG